MVPYLHRLFMLLMESFNTWDEYQSKINQFDFFFVSMCTQNCPPGKLNRDGGEVRTIIIPYSLQYSVQFLYFCRRNQNYTNILRFLNLGDKKLNPFDITHRFTHLFWLGDLNYRVEFPSTVSCKECSSNRDSSVRTCSQKMHSCHYVILNLPNRDANYWLNQ